MKYLSDKALVYQGKVWHSRFGVRQHKFSVNSFYWQIPLHRVDWSDVSMLISNERFNLFSLQKRNHFKWCLPRDSWFETINDQLKQNSFPKATSVYLVTHLSILGYCFNPVSFYYCYDKKRLPICCIVEVNNTFGEQKVFFCPPSHSGFSHNAMKKFYVSPFFAPEDIFNFSIPFLSAQELNFNIDTYSEGQLRLNAGFSGSTVGVKGMSPLRLFLRFPFHTLLVITLIHWHALRLFLKKIPYFKKNDVDQKIKKLLLEEKP
jgi:uncharacterized protein